MICNKIHEVSGLPSLKLSKLKLNTYGLNVLISHICKNSPTAKVPSNMKCETCHLIVAPGPSPYSIKYSLHLLRLPANCSS